MWGTVRGRCAHAQLSPRSIHHNSTHFAPRSGVPLFVGRGGAEWRCVDFELEAGVLVWGGAGAARCSLTNGCQSARYLL